MNILGLITSRAGSKRIPGKNMKLLGGKPLVEYTWDAARQSSLADSLMVSTDDDEMLQYFADKKIGVVRRPEWLARDRTPHLPVVIHAVEHCAFDPDAVMILQPTSPFRKWFHINEAIRILEQKGLDSLVSVEPSGKRNGAIYLFRTAMVFSKEPTFFSKDNGIEYPMSARESTNIDTPEDWTSAEDVLKL